MITEEFHRDVLEVVYYIEQNSNKTEVLSQKVMIICLHLLASVKLKHKAGTERVKKKKLTIDGWTVRITWLLQAGHGQCSLNPHIREFVSNSDQHGLVDVIKEVIIYLGILCHTTQQFVDKLAHTETHRMAIGFMRLRRTKAESSTGAVRNSIVNHIRTSLYSKC